jgi:uncharacterized membrane protein
MIIIDFLFNIWFSLFQKAEKGGRLAAVIFLSPSLTFIVMGIVIILIYTFFDVRISSHISALVGSLTSFILFAIIYLLLEKCYVKNGRDAGHIRYPNVHSLLVPVLLLGSLFFFIYTIDKFG